MSEDTIWRNCNMCYEEYETSELTPREICKQCRDIMVETGCNNMTRDDKIERLIEILPFLEKLVKQSLQKYEDGSSCDSEELEHAIAFGSSKMHEFESFYSS